MSSGESLVPTDLGTLPALLIQARLGAEGTRNVMCGPRMTQIGPRSVIGFRRKELGSYDWLLGDKIGSTRHLINIT